MRAIKSLVMFLTGFCAFITIEVLFRGYSYVMSGVMGGLAVIALDRINDEISWDMDLWMDMPPLGFCALIGGTFVTAMEFAVGTIAKYTNILPQMWDYTDVPFNLGGIICLPFTIAWTLLSVLAIFLADAINYYIFEDTKLPEYILFGTFRIRFKPKKCERNPDE